MKIFTCFVILLVPALIFSFFPKETGFSETKPDFYASRTFPPNEAHPCATEVRFTVVTETLEFPGELLNNIRRQNLQSSETQFPHGTYSCLEALLKQTNI